MKQFSISFVLLVAIGCQRESSSAAAEPASQPQSLPTVTIPIANRNFILEVADDIPKQNKGLMNRDSMPGDHGMIFVFSDETERNFWMKNTRIALDILYLDHKGKVVSVATMKPLDLTSVPSHGPAEYAIELNAGIAQAIGIKAGDQITVPPAVIAK